MSASRATLWDMGLPWRNLGFSPWGSVARAGVVTAGLVAAGSFLVKRGGTHPREDAIIHRLQSWREEKHESSDPEFVHAVDATAGAISWLSSVPQTITAGVLCSGLVWCLTKDPKKSFAPLAALGLETSIFLISSSIERRERPVDVWRPDHTYATGSFPSGHTAAAIALYATMGTLLWRKQQPTLVSRLVALDLILEPGFDVAFARIYRGQHHVSDVAAGALLGYYSAYEIRRALL